MSFWTSLSIGFSIVTSLISIIAHSMTLFVMWKYPVDKSWRIYRIAFTVQAIQHLSVSCPNLFSVVVHIMNNGIMMIILYGPAINTPKFIFDYIFLYCTALFFLLWQGLAVLSILQFLSLSRPYLNMTTRLMISYSFCLILSVISTIHFPDLLPNPGLERIMSEIVVRVHELSPNEKFYVYGAPLNDIYDNDGKTAIGVLFYGLVPTFMIAYAALMFCTYQVSRALRVSRIVALSSEKTKRAHRRLLVHQIVQGVIPSIWMTVVLAFLALSPLFFIDLDRLTLVFSFSIFLYPGFQGCINCFYARKAARFYSTEVTNASTVYKLALTKK